MSSKIWASEYKKGQLSLAFFLLWNVTRCQEKEPPRVAGGDFQDAPEQVIENMEVTFTEQGRRTGVLRADSVAIYRQGEVKKGRKIQVDFFDREGQQVSSLTAEEGTYDSKREEVAARGDVVVVSDTGARLETEALHWRKKSNRIFFWDVPPGKYKTVLAYFDQTLRYESPLFDLKEGEGLITAIDREVY